MEYHFLILLTFLSNFDAIRPVQVKTGESHFINPEKLWIESIMLRSVLHWNISTEHHLYSVYVKPKYHTAWTQVKNCTRVALTSCDVTRDLESPLVTYHVMLLVDDDDSYSLEFCPQHETSFLPPTYTSKLSKDTIFITPVLPINFGDGTPINKDLTTLIYEVKYWDPTESNKFKMKIASLHDSIITLQVNNGHQICLAMRLRMEFNPNRTSLWNEPSCFDNSATGPIKTNITYHVMKWTSVALSALFTVALLVFMAYKTIKMYRYVHKVGPIPEVLKTVREELESKHESTQNLAAEYENVVVLKLGITNLSRGNKSQLDTFSASGKKQNVCVDARVSLNKIATNRKTGLITKSDVKIYRYSQQG